ncbi:MAG: Phosphoribosylaminoimidazole-succinocarboxamide synthase [Candidatus Parcubacteria bacterium]|jgi:phosphoribosylaminoimidazole-succinocarboxamide synthase
MAQLPDSVRELQLDGEPASEYLGRRGFKLIHQGKVRDTYVNVNHPDRLLVIATDRISIFDFVLPTLIRGKGEVLTALSHFWLTVILSQWPNHLIPSVLAPRFNAAYDLAEDFNFRGSEFPLTRSLVVKRQNMQPFELIFRRHLGGSVWNTYQNTGAIGGHTLPAGLARWARLDQPLFTPSTKEEVGHDLNITADQYLAAMGSEGQAAHHALLHAYNKAYDYAYERGILILDTKFEVGSPFVFADEVLTPDSSRFTTVEEYAKAIAGGHDPVFYDKEPVRIWGRSVETPFGVTGINNLNPANPDHVAFVHSLEVPSHIEYDTTKRYWKIFYMLTGEDIDDYHRRAMGL